MVTRHTSDGHVCVTAKLRDGRTARVIGPSFCDYTSPQAEMHKWLQWDAQTATAKAK